MISTKRLQIASFPVDRSLGFQVLPVNLLECTSTVVPSRHRLLSFSGKQREQTGRLYCPLSWRRSTTGKVSGELQWPVRNDSLTVLLISKIYKIFVNVFLIYLNKQYRFILLILQLNFKRIFFYKIKIFLRNNYQAMHVMSVIITPPAWRKRG